MSKCILTQAVVEGKIVKVGDNVGFKCDIEQSGNIKAIWAEFNNTFLLLYRRDEGFRGEYIGGQNEHVEMARDCWVN